MRFFVVLFLLICPSLAFADNSAAITYSKTQIVIHRHNMQPAGQQPMPWQNGELPINVEVRDGMQLYNQKGWFNLSSYEDNSGVLMLFTQPDLHVITRSSQYAPADILFINAQGKITQIAPSIALSDLQEDVVPASPVLAFLFLKGGSSAALAINPGDEVEYPEFKKPPLILSAPQEVQPPLPLGPNVPQVTDLPLPPQPDKTKIPNTNLHQKSN